MQKCRRHRIWELDIVTGSEEAHQRTFSLHRAVGLRPILMKLGGKIQPTFKIIPEFFGAGQRGSTADREHFEEDYVLRKTRSHIVELTGFEEC